MDNFENGLTQGEAVRRLKIYGPNELRKKKFVGLKILGRQFQSSLVYLLIIASAISFWLQDYSDAVIIAAILFINTGLGFYQEYKSERIVERLEKFIDKQAIVRRGGENILIKESEIVLGDLLIIREGDIVGADMKLTKVEGLQIDESPLTGESLPQAKKIGDNLFAGSVISSGEGEGIVEATGDKTQLGGIAVLSEQTKRETEYERALRRFSSFLIKIVLLILTLVFIAKLIVVKEFAQPLQWTELFLFIIALAVAIVPEVLPVIATVSLARGALRLAKKHVVVKHLTSIEDFGNVNLLCTDKTGTITENKMTIVKIVSAGENFLLTLVCASIEKLGGRRKKIKNSYHEAFLNYASPEIKEQSKNFKIIQAMPFDPDARRERVVLFDESEKKYYLVAIGAPEELLLLSHEKAVSISHSERSEESRGEILRFAQDDMQKESRQGLRHLAVAYKEIKIPEIFSETQTEAQPVLAPLGASGVSGLKKKFLEAIENFDIVKNESDLNFLGYATLLDPLRSTAQRTIKDAEKLGVAIKILTGDNREVAEYIGRQVGLIAPSQNVFIGDELEKMSEEEFKKAIAENNVFARVSPAQKYKIIEVLKENNVVAYQGDGINDAPSLKLADVSIAVHDATDIAKESADIILLNKNLEVVIDGIKSGRGIFVNINKYIKHTMVGNFGNLIALAILYLFSADLPLLTIQVLLTSVSTDLPLIAVATDAVEEKDVALPVKHNVRELVFISLILGIPTGILELFYFWAIRSQALPTAQTSFFIFVTISQLITFYFVRNRDHFWRARQPSNIMNIALIATIILSIVIIYIPQFQKWFSFVSLPIGPLSIIAILMILYLFAADFVKVWYYKNFPQA